MNAFVSVIAILFHRHGRQGTILNDVTNWLFLSTIYSFFEIMCYDLWSSRQRDDTKLKANSTFSNKIPITYIPNVCVRAHSFLINKWNLHIVVTLWTMQAKVNVNILKPKYFKCSNGNTEQIWTDVENHVG